MKRLKPIALWAATLIAVASALLHFETDLLWKVQQHNVFLDSALFFKQQMVVPGGLLSYFGAFFTQHFYYPWVGVILLCGLWLLLMWLIERTFNIPGRWNVVTLIPVAILLLANMVLGYWVYIIKLPGYFFVPTLGVTAGTALVWAFRKVSSTTLSKGKGGLWFGIFFIVLVTLAGYPLMGVYALAAVILMGVLAWRRWLLGIVALLSVITIPLLYYRFVYYQTNISDIYTTALPAFSVNDNYPEYYIPYYALALCFLLLAVTFRENRETAPVVQNKAKVKGKKSDNKNQNSNLKGKLRGTVILQGLVLTALVGCVYHFWYKDANFQHELRMQRCVEKADWEGVIEEGKKQAGEPTRAIVMLHNLALSRLERQCDEMYKFPKGSSKINTPLPVYMYQIAGRTILYQYGLINECHHVCMEEGVEYGWNVEMLQYLARCAILNHETQAARKFLDILRQTCYYGGWADNMEKLLDDHGLLAKDRETGPITHMQHYKDQLGSAEGYVERYVMTNLAHNDSDDLHFQERAVLGSLWTRDPSLFWPRFEHYVELKSDGNIPRIFQEAAWLFANMEGQEGLDDWTLSKGVKESFPPFMKLLQQYRKTPNAQIRKFLLDSYGTTYYFEYFFLKDITYY